MSPVMSLGIAMSLYSCWMRLIGDEILRTFCVEVKYTTSLALKTFS